MRPWRLFSNRGLSGGVLRDLRLVVADYGDKGDDHGAHDGDDAKLFGVAAGDEGLVAGFKGVVGGADGADGVHVEDAAELASGAFGDPLVFSKATVTSAMVTAVPPAF